jgi:hypothetical protein
MVPFPKVEFVRRRQADLGKTYVHHSKFRATAAFPQLGLPDNVILACLKVIIPHAHTVRIIRMLQACTTTSTVLVPSQFCDMPIACVEII